VVLLRVLIVRYRTANSVCAGQFFAEHALYMNMVSLLSTTNMVNAVDENGNEIPPVVEFTGGFVRFDIQHRDRIA
jgi:hypothetical protein